MRKRRNKNEDIFTGFYDLDGRKIFLNDVLLLPNEPYAFVIMVGYDELIKSFIGHGGMTPHKEDQQLFQSDVFCKCINTRK